MKRILLLITVCILLALSGCAEAPWGKPNPDTTQTPTQEKSLVVNNTSTEYNYVFGVHKNPNIKNQSMVITNNRSEGEVLVTIYFEVGERSTQVSETVHPSEKLEVKLNQTALYVVEVQGATTGEYIVEESQFDCNSKQHRLWITEDGLQNQLQSTALACHTTSE